LRFKKEKKKTRKQKKKLQNSRRMCGVPRKKVKMPKKKPPPKKKRYSSNLIKEKGQGFRKKPVNFLYPAKTKKGSIGPPSQRRRTTLRKEGNLKKLARKGGCQKKESGKKEKSPESLHRR